MVSPRRASTVSTDSRPSTADDPQELGTMYDYLAKVILIGPSGAGKSCLLHRFVKDEFRVLTSQTIGVEFASKIVRLGTGSRRKRVKLQLWDTAGTERFRSISRSYYRGAAAAVLVYDVSTSESFSQLPTFLHDARTLASPHLTVALAGNKCDVADSKLVDIPPPPTPASSVGGGNTSDGWGGRSIATVAPDGRSVTVDFAESWAARHNVPLVTDVSALSGEGVDELFTRLAGTILTKIELGEIDPEDHQSGIQYGDSYWDTGSVKSRATSVAWGRGGHRGGSSLNEWGEVVGLRRGSRLCC